MALWLVPRKVFAWGFQRLQQHQLRLRLDLFRPLEKLVFQIIPRRPPNQFQAKRPQRRTPLIQRAFSVRAIFPLC